MPRTRTRTSNPSAEMASYLNLCRLCGKDFASVRAFDRHSRWKTEIAWKVCLTTDEMSAAWFVQDAKGRWGIGKDQERIRKHYQGLQRTAGTP